MFITVVQNGLVNARCISDVFFGPRVNQHISKNSTTNSQKNYHKMSHSWIVFVSLVVS